MAQLTVLAGKDRRIVTFDAAEKPTVQTVLEAAGVAQPHPCGGRGVCGKCRVGLSGAVSLPDAAETAAGCRLSCRAKLLGDAVCTLFGEGNMAVETALFGLPTVLHPMAGDLGAAVDIGTTTLALALVDLRSGAVLTTVTRRNPQGEIAADVMGRIGAAMAGKADHLQQLITTAIGEMVAEACAAAGTPRPDRMVVTGNTTMLTLLTATDASPLSHAPFIAARLFDEEILLSGIPTYLAPCIGGFVGADTVCAIGGSGMCDTAETALLCDVGTNGEMALWQNGRLYVTSTAAGPAFEGVGISCGCGAVPGAVDAVTWNGREMQIHTLGGVPACGVCGSGLISAAAAFLDAGWIDETGAADEELRLGDVTLAPRDIRALQTAKAAIAAGTVTLLQTAGCTADEVTALYIAGGFGSHLPIPASAAIGLFPETLCDRVRSIGNAALSGAVGMLLDTDRVEAARRCVASAEVINLGGNVRFNENYMDAMMLCPIS